MLSLCPNFKKENVFRWEHSISFDLATGLLFESLVRNPVSFNPLIVWNEIQMRSKQGVYMGSGLLLPHARVKELSSPLLAFGARDSRGGASRSLDINPLNIARFN